MKRNPMTDEEINTLARQIYRGEVFTSYNKGVTQHLLPIIFMPLMFLNEEARQDMVDGDVDMLYAPMSAQGPRAINGMPQFFECSWCNKEDTKKVFDKVEAIGEAVEGVTKEESNGEKTTKNSL